jgi:hypothetical protein
MPYLTQTRKQELEKGQIPFNAGDLNYCFTKLIIQYATTGGPLRYSTINDILGALEGAKLEFYRRIVVPYEEKKRAENGDVYPSKKSDCVCSLCSGIEV